jgi:uncharacterized membrane protein YdbT with pleckstrin-like domain
MIMIIIPLQNIKDKMLQMANIVMISLLVFIFLLVFMTYLFPITYKLKSYSLQ